MNVLLHAMSFHKFVRSQNVNMYLYHLLVEEAAVHVQDCSPNVAGGWKPLDFDLNVVGSPRIQNHQSFFSLGLRWFLYRVAIALYYCFKILQNSSTCMYGRINVGVCVFTCI